MWRTDKSCVVVALATLGAPVFAADSYMCHAPSGSTITAEFLPLECADVDIYVRGPSGAVKEVIHPLETAAQRKQREAEEKLAAENAKRAEEQKWADQALRQRYKSVADIETDRQRELAEPQKNLAGSIALLTKYAEDLIKLDDEVSQFYRPPHTVPPKIVQAYRDNRDDTIAMERYKLKIQDEIDGINKRFDEKRNRLEDLDRSDQLAREAHKSDVARP